MHNQIVIIMIAMMLTVFTSEAAIINVPDDHETIQAGIDAAEEGDTVLVDPGEYVENISFDGKAITVMGNSDDPNDVVIDGNENGSVVVFDQEEDENSILSGFVIQNGQANEDGGGIQISRSDPFIENCIIRNNSADARGGGINMLLSDAIIENCLILGNNATVGGGIYCLSSNPIILNCKIIDNDSEANGGGLRLNLGNPRVIGCEISGNSSSNGGAIRITSGEILIINCTIVNNLSRDNQGVVFTVVNDDLTSIINSIVWGNIPDQIVGPTIVNWSNIQDGWNEGEGNIDEDPLFIDEDNFDYHLVSNSPCIDTGDPEFPDELDGTRVDMGAFPFFQGGVIEGNVFDFSNNRPIDGAVVSTSYGVQVVTNEDGFFQIIPVRMAPFDITASMLGYLDSTLIDQAVDIEDTLTVSFNLLHAELEPSIENIDPEILIGDSEEINFTISNPGNGVLSWVAETRYRGDAGFDEWELRHSLLVGELLEDDKIYGVAFINTQYYISGSNRFRDEDGNMVSHPTIYVLNRDGELVSSFLQPGENRYGMKDLAFDGELLWGAVGNTIYGITLEGDVVTSFDAPHNPSSAITYDPDLDVLWIASTTGDPIGYDRDGNQVEGLVIERDGMYIYGLAYFEEDSDDAPLYIFNKERGTNRSTIHKYNFETNEMIFVAHLDHEAGGTPQGVFITNQFDNFSWTFMSVANSANNDRVDVWQLEANTAWSLLEPNVGVVNPGGEQDISLTINTANLIAIEYPAELIFTHNGFGLETVIPIDLTVTPLGVEDREDSALPTEFAISDVFPNPFNSTIRIHYTVPKMSDVSIKLYDITGSLIDIVTTGMSQSGRHTVMWNASSMPSGIYFARMEAGGFSQTIKLILMK